MSQQKPAIVVVGYNRVNSLKRILQAVGNAVYECNEIPLIISLDKSDCEDTLIKTANDFLWKHGEKKIRTFESRQGLRNHILQCGDLSEEYGAVIILEDDIFVSPSFYTYTQKALECYDKNEHIAGIALYSHKYNGYAACGFEPVNNGYDAYMGQFSITWGQCWSDTQWKAFRTWYDAHLEIPLAYRQDIPYQITNWPETSWGKYFVYYLVDTDKYYVMPYTALTTCFADEGEHTAVSASNHQVPILSGNKEYCFGDFADCEKYDIFFESVTIKKYLPEDILKAGVSIELAGKKVMNEDAKQHRYMLTTEIEDYEIVKTYDLCMRPKELNVIYQVEGEGIYLYDTAKKTAFAGHHDAKKKKVLYEAYPVSKRTALSYAILAIKQKLSRK